MGIAELELVFVNVAQTLLGALKTRLSPFINICSTDFSEDLVQGTGVKVPIVPVAADAVNPDSAPQSGDRTHSNVAPDIANTSSTVTLNQKASTGLAMSTYEFNQIAAGLRSNFLQKVAERKVNAIARNMWDYVINLMTAANFANGVTVNAATFDTDDLSAIRTTCDGLNWPDDDMGEQFALLGSTLHESLRSDPAVKNKEKSAADVLNTGELPRLSNFACLKAPRLPPAGGTPAAENLVGAVCLPDAIALAMRPSDAISGSTTVDFEDLVVDAETGIALAFTVWFSPATKMWYWNFEAFYGATAAQSASLIRLKTA